MTHGSGGVRERDAVERFIAAALRGDVAGSLDPQDYLGQLLRAGTTCTELAAVAGPAGTDGSAFHTDGRHRVVAAMLAVAGRRLDAGGEPQGVLADTCFDLVVLSYVWHVAEALNSASGPIAAPGFTLRRLLEWVRGGQGRAIERVAAATVNRNALPWMRMETAAFLYAACIGRRWLGRDQAEPLTRHYRLRDVGQVRALRPLGRDHPFAGMTVADVVAGGSTRPFRVYVDERYQVTLRSLARWEVFVAWSRYQPRGALLGDPRPAAVEA